MATLTSELPAMAHNATLLIFRRFVGAVAIDPVVCVGSRFEMRTFCVALRTTERVIDLVMANQTVRHVWEECRRDAVGPLYTSMT